MPVDFVEAVDEAEAKQKLLRMNSQYGEMSAESIAQFTEGIAVEWEALSLPDSGRLVMAFDADPVDAPVLADGDRQPFRQMTFTVHDEQFEIIEEAVARAKSEGGGTSDVNENSNGNALAWICARFCLG